MSGVNAAGDGFAQLEAGALADNPIAQWVRAFMLAEVLAAGPVRTDRPVKVGDNGVIEIGAADGGLTFNEIEARAIKIRPGINYNQIGARTRDDHHIRSYWNGKKWIGGGLIYLDMVVRMGDKKRTKHVFAHIDHDPDGLLAKYVLTSAGRYEKKLLNLLSRAHQDLDREDWQLVTKAGGRFIREAGSEGRQADRLAADG